MKRSERDRSIHQRVANQAQERRLSRDDAFTAYVMDRLLARLGRSAEAGEFYLKGGVLVANFVDVPYRFTRDIDVLRRHGPPDPIDLRERFRQVVAVDIDDGVSFMLDGVRALPAEHDEDGYDGVKVFLGALVGPHSVEIRVDIGFGDAMVPPASRIFLHPFLPGDEPARVFAYAPHPFLAEKIQTVLSKFPAIRHRLKDILDVVMVAGGLDLDGATMLGALGATLKRRNTPADVEILDDMGEVLVGRRWSTDWATMIREKAVAMPLELHEAVSRFDRFTRPLLVALSSGTRLGDWTPALGWHLPPVTEMSRGDSRVR